jgi:pimeloyl-ACP methyl ester carboxylesterase
MTGTIDLPGGELEVVEIPGKDPPLLLLHSGLGSARLWDQFPDALAKRTGCRIVAFSRHGHGASAPPPKPRTPRFMHEEARSVLPELLARAGLENPVLIGHSDGASVALIYAADNHVPGLVAIAPHVFVEEVCVSEIARVRESYVSGELKQRMQSHHRDPDAAFFGWSEVWLDPEFRKWDIRELVACVDAPMLLIQGTADQFGTLTQLDEIERLAPGPVQRLQLDCRHAPFVQRAEETVDAVARFIAGLQADRPAGSEGDLHTIDTTPS